MDHIAKLPFSPIPSSEPQSWRRLPRFAALWMAAAVCFVGFSQDRAIAGDLAVETNFEGASAKVVEIDQQARSIRFEPGGDPREGWPCWWNFRITGAKPGETVTLWLRAVSTPIEHSNYRWLKGKPLSLSWASPHQAVWSTDGETWHRTEPGRRDGEWMVYQLKAANERVFVAWGPTYTPTRAIEFARACAEKHPAMVKAETLCRSREGRSVAMIRIAEGSLPTSKRMGIWVHARQHAWESGSSWVAQGFTEWLLGDSAEAAWVRQNAEIFVVPVMDVDHVANGHGGKEAIPQDHNRDWSDSPYWPEVAAAQSTLRELSSAGRLRAFVDLHNPSPGDRTVHYHTSPDDWSKPGQRVAMERFFELSKTYLAAVMPVDPKAIKKSGANYDQTWKRMSRSWVAANGPDNTLAVCIETPWNIEQSTQEGYRKMGAAIGMTLHHQLREADDVAAR